MAPLTAMPDRTTTRPSHPSFYTGFAQGFLAGLQWAITHLQDLRDDALADLAEEEVSKQEEDLLLDQDTSSYLLLLTSVLTDFGVFPGPATRLAELYSDHTPEQLRDLCRRHVAALRAEGKRGRELRALLVWRLQNRIAPSDDEPTNSWICQNCHTHPCQCN